VRLATTLHYATPDGPTVAAQCGHQTVTVDRLVLMNLELVHETCRMVGLTGLVKVRRRDKRVVVRRVCLCYVRCVSILILFIKQEKFGLFRFSHVRGTQYTCFGFPRHEIRRSEVRCRHTRPSTLRGTVNEYQPHG